MIASENITQNVYLTIRRQKTSIFLDAKEYNTVYDLKQMIKALTKVLPENQQLYKDGEVMEDNKTLEDYNLNCCTAKSQDPAEIGLAYRENESSGFENLDITPYSIPPELPEIMRPLPEIEGQAQAMA
ncbi:unnamed protein product [Larinioides sclopetarius]|uniref:Ubiquitin-like domain-containing protein n=1 Tax=Larinioides sclopetarius TaxID=280406 RepID=A0AAV2BE06_9ARAC